MTHPDVKMKLYTRHPDVKMTHPDVKMKLYTRHPDVKMTHPDVKMKLSTRHPDIKMKAFCIQYSQHAAETYWETVVK